MNVDDFTDKLTVQTSTVSYNASNEPVESWSTFCEPWGKVEPKTGDEHSLPDAMKVESEVEYLVKLRADPDTRRISPRMRIVWNDHGTEVVLAVSAVLRKSGRDMIELLAQERNR